MTKHRPLLIVVPLLFNAGCSREMDIEDAEVLAQPVIVARWQMTETVVPQVSCWSDRGGSAKAACESDPRFAAEKRKCPTATMRASNLKTGNVCTATCEIDCPAVCPSPLPPFGGGGSQCNSKTCPNGCCNAAGMCVTSGDAACGKAGSLCIACGSGQKCVDGVCKCNAASCPTGCCKNEMCIKPSDNNNCGLNGAQCATCGTGQECKQGMCSCTPTSCAAGCCSGNQCTQPPTRNACGSKGSACVTCKADEICDVGGLCGPLDE